MQRLRDARPTWSRRPDGAVNYVALRDACPFPTCRSTRSAAATKDARTTVATKGSRSRLTARGCSPSSRIHSSTSRGPNNGRNGRNITNRRVRQRPAQLAPTRKSLAQYVYQLEPQADVAARINAIMPGNATATDPRQGRNIGVSAIIAINDTQFLVLERDNRGIGVDDPRRRRRSAANASTRSTSAGRPT